jgi:hypothetical protein
MVRKAGAAGYFHLTFNQTLAKLNLAKPPIDSSETISIYRFYSARNHIVSYCSYYLLLRTR